MKPESQSILLGTSLPESLDSLTTTLKSIGYCLNIARESRDVTSHLQANRDRTVAVLLDLTGNITLETVAEIRRTGVEIPVIVLSEAASVSHIVSAMNAGATDFLSKPVTEEELRSSILRSLERKGNDSSRDSALDSRSQFFLGRNPKLNELHRRIEHMSWSDAPVLILGETGSGKEVVARELHAHSSRRDNRFVKLNCAALPSELVESELFGYERGAFTSAFQQQPGILESSNGGTILLDEIGDMAIALQAKLLHVLQDREFYRVGGRKPIQIDVRVIAATHRNLEAAVLEGSFREDLFYRLNVIDIHVPALRERKEDLPELTDFLIAKHARPGVAPPVLSAELRRAIQSYHWPGNVRELENFVQKLIVTGDGEKLCRDLVTRSAPRFVLPQSKPSVDEPAEPILDQVTKEKAMAEAEAILSALNTTGWNRKEAAALLKSDYRGLLYKMKKLGIGRAARTAGCAFSEPD